MYQIGRIYYGLWLLREVQFVGRIRVNCILQPFQYFLTHLFAELSLFCVIIGQCQPWSDPGQCTAYSFQVSNLVISPGVSASCFYRHIPAQGPLCQIVDDRVGYFPHQLYPCGTVFGAGGHLLFFGGFVLFTFGLQGRCGQYHYRYQQ